MARAAAEHLTAFVVPGLEVARMAGLDVEAAGLRVVATPRHASVLVLVGEIPPDLGQAAAVTYAQMARPRALLAAGSTGALPLPVPDVMVALDQDALAGGVARLRRLVATGAWSPDAVPFGPALHPVEGQLAAEEQQGGDGDMRHDHGGAMSMAMMANDLAGAPFHSPDGLRMEWIEVPFGPLFPGLPGGLALSYTLDGDTVARSKVVPGAVARGLAQTWPGPVAGFPERLARLDPLSPVAYRLLAYRALDAAESGQRTRMSGVSGVSGLARGGGVRLPRGRASEVMAGSIGALELERARSHLIWLAGLGSLLGDGRLVAQAVALQQALRHAGDIGAVAHLRERAREFVRGVQRIPLLRHRLGGIGRLAADLEAAQLSGPIGRAAGQASDARGEEIAYRALGFTPVVYAGGDALARLRVRLAEIVQSLDLAIAAGAVTEDTRVARSLSFALSGTGTAMVETPRGAATLRLRVEHGTVYDVHLDTPSARHVDLVKGVAEGQEVADALVAVASLDLSPWEIDR